MVDVSSALYSGIDSFLMASSCAFKTGRFGTDTAMHATWIFYSANCLFNYCGSVIVQWLCQNSLVPLGETNQRLGLTLSAGIIATKTQNRHTKG